MLLRSTDDMAVVMTRPKIGRYFDKEVRLELAPIRIDGRSGDV